MFFRRARPRQLSFAQRLQNLRAAGFLATLQPGGRAELKRDGCAVVIEDVPGSEPRLVSRPGLLVDGEPASLVDAGFQKFFQTPSGKRRPALAQELQATHRFEQDLREGLGAAGLYNEALGTVSSRYLYDRLQDRDRGVPRRAWE